MKKLVVILGILALGVTMAFAYGPGMGRGYQNGMMGNQGGMEDQGGMMEYQRQQPYDRRPGYHRGEPDYKKGRVPGYQKNMPGHNYIVPFYGNQQSK